MSLCIGQSVSCKTLLLVIQYLLHTHKVLEKEGGGGGGGVLINLSLYKVIVVWFYEYLP